MHIILLICCGRSRVSFIRDQQQVGRSLDVRINAEFAAFILRISRLVQPSPSKRER